MAVPNRNSSERSRANAYLTSAFAFDQNIDSTTRCIDAKTKNINHTNGSGVRLASTWPHRIVRIRCILRCVRARVRNNGIATHDAKCFTLIRNESKMSRLPRLRRANAQRLIPNERHLWFDCISRRLPKIRNSRATRERRAK